MEKSPGFHCHQSLRWSGFHPAADVALTALQTGYSHHDVRLTACHWDTLWHPPLHHQTAARPAYLQTQGARAMLSDNWTCADKPFRQSSYIPALPQYEANQPVQLTPAPPRWMMQIHPEWNATAYQSVHIDSSFHWPYHSLDKLLLHCKEHRDCWQCRPHRTDHDYPKVRDISRR